MSLDWQEINRNNGIEVIIRPTTAHVESRCGTMDTGLRAPRPFSEYLAMSVSHRALARGLAECGEVLGKELLEARLVDGLHVGLFG